MPHSVSSPVAGRTRFCVLMAMVLLTASCASAPKQQTVSSDVGPIFFPQPPDPPRVQFLTSFDDSSVFGTEESGTTFRGFFLGEEENVGRMFKPYGVTYHDGAVFVCDTLKALVHVFDFRVGQYRTIGDEGRGRLRKPINVAIGEDGTRYVADVGRGQIVVFDPADRFIRTIGNREECSPSDAVVIENEIFIVDVRNHEIERRDVISGALLGTFGGAGQGEGKFFKPANIAADAKNRLYVSDPINARIQIFERDGTLLEAFGEPGDSLSSFTRPKGIAVGPDGLIYVVDAGFETVSIFGADTQLYMFFGGPGAKGGQLWLPAGVTTTAEGLQYFRQYVAPDFEPEYLIVVVSQYGDRRVSVYAKGHAAQTP